MKAYDSYSRDELIKELISRDERILHLEEQLGKNVNCSNSNISLSKDDNIEFSHIPKDLSNRAIERYSRQMILPELGPTGQKTLISSSVLIVGCGGLGCPAAIYLAAAGIGKIGLCDSDSVEISNLHRQVLHTESRIGKFKALSALTSIKALNSDVLVVPHVLSIDSTNANEIISQYDIVLDCTDNVPTRYLLNDICVILGKPLVSGSALRLEGHITVFNHNGGPCYRCLFPKPPPASMVTNCSDGGVLGVVPGIIGCIQALDAIKIALKMDLNDRPSMLVMDAQGGNFRSIRLRPRQKSCIACGENADLKLREEDYLIFCGLRADDKTPSLNILNATERLTVHDYQKFLADSVDHLLVDVRPYIEYEICALKPSLNIPLNNLSDINNIKLLTDTLGHTNEVVCVCRRGNDSQKSVEILKSVLSHNVTVRDITGGLIEWSLRIDKDFPSY